MTPPKKRRKVASSLQILSAKGIVYHYIVLPALSQFEDPRHYIT